MEENLKYKRVLLKLSGEVLAGDKKFGVDVETVGKLCDKIKEREKQNNIPIKLTREETNELLNNLQFEKDYKIQNGIITIFETNKTYLLPQI